MSALTDFQPGQAVTYQHEARCHRGHGRIVSFGGYVLRANCKLVTVRLHVGNGKWINRAVRPERLKINRSHS